MRLTLRDDGYSFKKIMQGRQWIGRVAKMADGSGYLGIIGKLTVTAAPASDAFDEVGAQHMGYRSAAALRAHNRKVRQVQRAVGGAADHAINEMERGNFAPFEKMLTHPATGAALVGAFTRSLKRTTRRSS